MNDDINDIMSSIAALKIDSQLHVKRNTQIKPGMYTKVSCDHNGLITKGDVIDQSDIPMLRINKITGLKSELDSKVNESDVKQIIQDTVGEIPRRSVTAVASGVKINYDKYGYVVSSSELTEDDIPTIGIDKVEGLRNRLSLIDKREVDDQQDDFSTTPGSHTKITYDSKGRVTGGNDLTLDDIPNELLVRLNIIESKLPQLASQVTVSALSNDITQKIDANTKPVNPGSYTKVNVDIKGLVTKGESITIKDLPELHIGDISGLKSELINKANQSDLVELNDTVSSLVSSMNRIGDVTNIKNTLQTKADDSDVRELRTRIDRLDRLMNDIISTIPSELITNQLTQIRAEVNSISARVTTLERKSNIPQ